MEPLKSYGPEGEIIAFSYDGGKQWVQVPDRKKQKPVQHDYDLKIAAVSPAEGSTPSFERRIVNSFAPLKEANILAGWGPLPQLMALPENSLDVIVIPFGTIHPDELKEVVQSLHKQASKVLIDIDSGIISETSMFRALVQIIPEADGVLVPSDLIAMSLRSHNPNTFCVPPTINSSVWKGVKREPSNGPIRVAVHSTPDRHVQDAIEWMKIKYENKITLVDDHWDQRSIYDEPGFYTNIDVVIAGPPPNRQYVSSAAVLPAMVGGCCIVGDSVYSRILMHNHSAILVAERGPSPWRKELSHAILDSRTRVKMQAGARERSRLFAGRTLLHRLALPYRVLMKQ